MMFDNITICEPKTEKSTLIGLNFPFNLIIILIFLIRFGLLLFPLKIDSYFCNEKSNNGNGHHTLIRHKFSLDYVSIFD